MEDPPHLYLRLRLSILMFLQYAVPGAFVPVQTVWFEELGFTPMEVGAICATQALAALIATWVVGQVADRWVAVERCLVVCGLVAAACLWLLASSRTPAEVFAACFAFWLVMVPASTLGTTLCFTHLPRPERDFGPVRLWGTIGWVWAGWMMAAWFNDDLRRAIFSGELAETRTLADIFRLGAILAVLLGVYAWTLPHTPPVQQASARFAPLDALHLLRHRSFAVFALCTLGVTATLAFPSQVTPLLLQNLGIPRQWLNATLTIAQSMEVVSLALLPVLLLQLGMRGTMRLGLMAWLLALSILTLGQPTWLVVVSQSLNGLCISGYLVAGQVFVNSRARGDIRASAQGLITFINGLGLLFGNLLVGVVRQEVDEAFAPTFGVAAGLAALLLVVFQFGFPPDEKVEPLEKIPDTSVPAAQSG